MRHLRFPLPTTPTVRALRAGALGALGLGVVAGVIMAARSEAAAELMHQADLMVVDAGARAGLRLQHIGVKGRVQTPGGDVLGAIGVARGEPLLAFDPAAARERLESLPWVKEATVERRLPDTIFIRLIERTPIAVWQTPDESFALVDADGVVMPVNVAYFPGLPVIAGPGAPEAASDLFTMLAAEPALNARVKAAVRVGKRRWNVWLDAIGDGGIDIRLPESDPAQALARLVTLDRDEGLLRRDLAMIDLRLPDRLIVRVNETAAQPVLGSNKRRNTPDTLPLGGRAEDA
jgi:cell division protein FtsQ